jgi:hypothetical protein
MPLVPHSYLKKNDTIQRKIAPAIDNEQDARNRNIFHAINKTGISERLQMVTKI